MPNPSTFRGLSIASGPCHKRPQPTWNRRRATHEKTDPERAGRHRLRAAASAALAQDVAAGKSSFNKCLACHAIGEGAKNKVGPVLNGLDGRKSGTVEGYSYTDANKNSGITWNKDTFLDYIKDPEGEDSRHQDGVRRHQEREGSQRSLGVPRAIRQGRQDQVRPQAHGSRRAALPRSSP